uniref:Uncharacterized protein n=1 Tax=Aegilops tauschii TaxID=37682 RepID=M8CJJ6_AEGTA
MAESPRTGTNTTCPIAKLHCSAPLLPSVSLPSPSSPTDQGGQEQQQDQQLDWAGKRRMEFVLIISLPLLILILIIAVVLCIVCR